MDGDFTQTWAWWGATIAIASAELDDNDLARPEAQRWLDQATGRTDVWVAFAADAGPDADFADAVDHWASVIENFNVGRYDGLTEAELRHVSPTLAEVADSLAKIKRGALDGDPACLPRESEFR